MSPSPVASHSLSGLIAMTLPYTLISSLPDAASQTRTRFESVVASHLLFGLMARAFTCPRCSRRARSRPVAASQIRAVLSLLAVASHVPSGLIATAFTLYLCCMRLRSRPEVVSQIRAVPSKLPVTIHFRSGLIATASTRPPCCRRARSRLVRSRSATTALRVSLLGRRLRDSIPRSDDSPNCPILGLRYSDSAASRREVAILACSSASLFSFRASFSFVRAIARCLSASAALARALFLWSSATTPNAPSTTATPTTDETRNVVIRRRERWLSRINSDCRAVGLGRPRGLAPARAIHDSADFRASPLSKYALDRLPRSQLSTD
jgi:hypothetical protein